MGQCPTSAQAETRVSLGDTQASAGGTRATTAPWPRARGCGAQMERAFSLAQKSVPGPPPSVTCCDLNTSLLPERLLSHLGMGKDAGLLDNRESLPRLPSMCQDRRCGCLMGESQPEGKGSSLSPTEIPPAFSPTGQDAVSPRVLTLPLPSVPVPDFLCPPA